MEKCETEDGAKSLQKAALAKYDNPQLIAEVCGVDWKVINARELFYHRSCKRNYTRPARGKAVQSSDTFQSLIDFIELNVISNGMVISMSDVQNVYREFIQDHGESSSAELPHLKTLRCRIQAHFQERVGFWSPRSGCCFLYSEEIPKGQVIEVGQRIQSKSGASQDSSIFDKVREVALCIRKEVLESYDTFSQWPPTEDELLNSDTVLPKLLETLISTLLTKRKKPSSRKQRRIFSIGQDIVYSIKNGKDRTMKHVLLSLCTKRKTGSKQVGSEPY